MQKTSSKRSPLRRRAGHFGRIVRHSAVTPRTGETHLPKLVSEGQLGITFIGHSSFFIQIGGRNVIIDPNFARWLFILKRLRQPGVRLRDLVADLGFKEVIELNWWHCHRESNLTITHVPSRHWGARILKDSYRGYGGYVIQGGSHSIYHAGDTAYFFGFSEIGQSLKPEVALLPIGAYSPASFRNVHTSPADAVRAFLDLKARWMIPMHYGTFRLSHEPMEEPLELLRLEARSAGIEGRVLVLEEGVTSCF